MTRTLVLASLLVAGCSADPPPAVDAGSDAPVLPIDAGSDAGPPPCPFDAWPAASADREAAVLAELNARRATTVMCGSTAYGPSPALTAHASLTRSTRCHAHEMVLRGLADPRGLDGSTWEERAATAGYAGLPTAEAIGYLGDTQTPAAIVDLILGNVTNCAGFLSETATDIGIGMSRDPAATGARTTYFELVAGH